MSIDVASKRRLASVLWLGMLCMHGLAVAQGLPQGDTVANRPRDSLDPLGIRLGAFGFFPRLGLQHVSDSNVFATRENTIADDALVLRPSLTLRSDWSRNSLVVDANAALNRFSDLETEDHDNSSILAAGRWDTANNGFFYADVDHSVNHEGRESADDARGLSRARFESDGLTLGYRVAPGRMLVQFDIDALTLDYDDVPGTAGTINHDDRDRDQLVRRVRVGYELSEGYSVFVQAMDRTTDYEFLFDDNGFERSSNGSELLVGAAMNVTDVVFGDVFVGEKSQDFDDPRFTSIGGRAYGIDVAWNITRLTTLNFQGRQEVTPTTIIDAAGIDSKRLGFRADHELLRNLILSLEWSKETQDFNGIDRRDENSLTSLGARYLMNRRLEIQADYESRDRNSTAAADLEFSKRVIRIQVLGQL